MSLENIEFFGNTDRGRGGAITSQYPGWFFDSQIDELAEEVRKQKYALESGMVEPDKRPYAEMELREHQDKLQGIYDSRPKLKGKDLTELEKLHESLSGKISDIMFTRYDQEKGLVRPQDELNRAKIPSIKVDPAVAAKFGITAVKGKVNRDQATRMWQMSGKVLQRDINPERLRREGNVQAFKSMDEFTERILRQVSNGR